MVYVPCGDVTAPRCCPVSRFATVICAAASGAPPAPVTRPCRFTVFCASKPGGGAGDEPSGGQQHSAESVSQSRRHRTILLCMEPVRSALLTAPELEDIRPAGRQRQRDRHDAARERTERTRPALVDPLDLPAGRETIGGR